MKDIVLIAYPLGGKDTQSDLLIKYYKSKSISFLYLTTGSEFRALGDENHSLSLIKETMNSGLLVPDFLATGIVTNCLIHNFTGKQNLIFNGFPRTKNQGKQFLDMMNFYRRKPIIIFLKTSKKEVEKRMKSRFHEARPDDTREIVIERFKVFQKENSPLINFLRAHFECRKVDGSGTPEDVHLRIMELIS